MKWIVRIVLLLVVLAGLGYYPLVLHSPEPGSAPYVLNMAEVRREAERVPGEKAMRVEVERIAGLVFAEAMVMAGEPWQSTPIPVYSYRLVFPERSIVVDTAMTNTRGLPGAMVEDLDKQALDRMQAAMEQADQIVITHEHFDHIGGLLDHPRLPDLLDRTLLTAEQLAHEDRMQPLRLPHVLDDYQPLEYEDLYALAPGVVLIEAPGHTPGSQMVYVQLDDGRELLLLGDVAWQQRNIDAVRERPLFITLMIKENRSQVIEQFQTLNELARALPALHMVPGHDGAVVDRLIEAGMLHDGFGGDLADAR